MYLLLNSLKNMVKVPYIKLPNYILKIRPKPLNLPKRLIKNNGSIIFSVGEKSPALFLYTQKASDFRYDVSKTKHIRKEIDMAYLHSTALLLGIKDPHIKLT